MADAGERRLPLLEDLGDVRGARVLVRTDFNVPLTHDAAGERVVADDYRIRTALPTLRWLLERGAVLTACSHLGRPDGHPDERWTMEPVRRRLEELCPGVRLTENLRFDPGEKHCEEAFVRGLVAGHDAYVNEAFGVCHRAHASVVGPPRLLPSAAGRQVAREVEVLHRLRTAPERPFVAVVGGAKVSDKLGLLRVLSQQVDTLVVGGAMAFTFLAALGHEVGNSVLDVDHLEDCRQILASGASVVLPVDVVALEPGGELRTEATGPSSGDTKVLGVDVPDGWTGYDIGPETAEAFAAAVTPARTVLWNGPVGACEDPRFAAGTAALARAVADCAGYTVVGGGDSAAALDALGLADAVSFLSTGGGASLAYLEHGDLPGLAALRQAVNAPAAD